MNVQFYKNEYNTRSVDLTGQRFGELVVVSFAGYSEGSQHRHATWNCLCACGRERTLRATRLLCGCATTCSKCAVANAVSRREYPRLPGDLAALRRLIGNYRNHAKKRNLAFNLPENLCRTLFTQPCNYCGATPSSICRPKFSGDSFSFNGIDRINNCLGYETTNVVTCCSVCNYAKRNMTTVEFLGWIERAYTHLFVRAK